MSCMLISETTYNNIYRTLQFACDVRFFSKQCCEFYHLGDLVHRWGLDDYSDGMSEPCSVLAFVQSLYKFNLRALDERYEDTQTGEDELEKFSSRIKKGEKLTLIQLMKSLQCIDYQCSDCKEYRETIRKSVQHFTSEVAELILSETEEYRLANWG